VIATDLYSKIHSLLPIACIDLVIVRHNTVLLVKRKNEPLRDQWFIPGGRLIRNEPIIDAVERIAQEEVGLTVSRAAHFVRFDNLILDTDPFGHGLGTHTMSLVFATKATDDNQVVVLDSTQHDYADWIRYDKVIDGEYHHYVKQAVLARFNHSYV